MGQPFPAEITGGNGVLLVPAIQSPNFSLANKSGWSIMQNGNAYFFNITAEGSVTANTVIIEGANGGLFVYSTSLISTSTFTSGSGNWTAPAQTQFAVVQCWGGGGGGGGSGGSSASGGNGNTSTFIGNVATVTAHGGSGGGGTSTGTPGTGGAAGSGSGNTTHFNGGAGATGNPNIPASGGGGSSAGTAAAGNAGGNPAGGSAPAGGAAGGAGTGTFGAGSAGSAPGGGGGGALTSFGPGPIFAAAGGGGGGEYAQEPMLAVTAGNSYAYSVGAGGTAGTGSQNGGAGANGKVVVAAYGVTLTASIVGPGTTTDPFGNPVLNGITSYANDGFGTFIQELTGLLIFGNTTFPTIASGAGAIDLQTAGGLLIEAGSTGGAVQLNQNGTVEVLANRPLQLDNITSSAPGASASGPLAYGSNGKLLYAGGDGNAYTTGHQILVLGSDTPVSSTSPVTLLTTNVAASGQYLVSGWIRGVNGASGTLQAQTMRLSGSCTVNSLLVRVWSTAEFANTASPPMANGAITALNADPSNVRTPALNESFDIVFEGIVNVNAAGTLTLQAREVTSSSDVSWTAKANSYMILRSA